MSRLYKIKSFDNFSEELQERMPSTVVVQAARQPASGQLSTSFTSDASELGDFQKGLLYSVIAKGQRSYMEPIFTSFQREFSFADTTEQIKRVLQLLLAGEVRVGLLRTALPETDVNLAGSNALQPMNDQELMRLHETAERYNVEVPAFTA